MSWPLAVVLFPFVSFVKTCWDWLHSDAQALNQYAQTLPGPSRVGDGPPLFASAFTLCLPSGRSTSGPDLSESAQVFGDVRLQMLGAQFGRSEVESGSETGDCELSLTAEWAPSDIEHPLPCTERRTGEPHRCKTN